MVFGFESFHICHSQCAIHTYCSFCLYEKVSGNLSVSCGTDQFSYVLNEDIIALYINAIQIGENINNTF